MARDQRRLAAIVSADVVGYSRLMGVDESGTRSRVKSYVQGLFDPKVSEYGGRVVKTMGDGLLLEFASVVDAIRCAVGVQRAMAERNDGVPADRRIDFRIGINIGDIIIEGDDIFGDGVNVAARLQALAEPGQICVSKVVRDQVIDKLGFAFKDLGAQKVKNIARPVEAYRVELSADALPNVGNSTRPWTQFGRFGALRWLGAAIVALSAVGVAVWAMLEFKKAPQVPEPPAFSLAVLPFSVSGEALGDQQFADLVVHGIVSTLGRTTHWVTVTSLGTATNKASESVDAPRIARDLNVRYLLQGNLRLEGDTAKVDAKLIDARTTTQLWAGQLVAPRSQWTSEAGAASQSLVRDLRDVIWRAEEQRVARQLTHANSTPSDLVIRAAILEREPSPKRLAEARALVDEAIRKDPNLVLALRERALINVLIWENDPSADRVQLATEADAYARRALAIDRSDPGVWRDRASALAMQWRWDAALDALAEAHRLDASNVADVVGRGWLLRMTGKADESLRIADQALARDPSLDVDPDFRHNQCYAQLLLGRFDEAVTSCEKSTAGGDSWWPYFFLTVAYAQVGDMAKAAVSKVELLRRRPEFTMARLNAMGLSDNAVYLKQAEANITPGLRKAGVPEK